MNFLVFALVLAQALAIQAGPSPGNDVEALCSGKSIDLTHYSQLKELADQVRGSSCSPMTKVAIIELSAIMNQDKQNLCSVDAMDTLRGFYNEYLETSGPNGNKKEQLPEPLKKFAIAYGLQMSNLCKKHMVKALTEESHKLLTPEDYELIEDLTKSKGPIDRVLGEMGGPDDVFMPGDLAPFLKSRGIEQKSLGEEKVFLQAATNGYIKKLKDVCQYRFKKLYDPLMVPLVRLANMGFNYKDEPLKCDLQCPKVVEEIGQWSRIVFLCESLSTIEVVEEQEDKEASEGTSGKLVRILTKEEADAIQGVHSDSASESAVAELEYQPQEAVVLEDLVYDKKDQMLCNAIDSFATNNSEEELIKKRMMGKGLSIIKKQLKKGNVGIVVGSAWKALTRKSSDKIESPNEMIVKSLDQMVERKNQPDTDGAVSMDQDDFSIMMNIISGVVLAAIFIGLTLLISWALLHFVILG